MAIKTLNSVAGFSVTSNDGNVVIIIDSNGNVTTPDLTVSGTSNLGPASNVKISGGATGFVLSTDGASNLSWVPQSGGGGNTFLVAPMPYLINVNEIYYVTANHQGLFNIPIQIDGALQVDGILVEV